MPHLNPLLLALACTLVLTASAHAKDQTHAIVDDAWSGATGVHFSGRLTEVHAMPEADQGKVRTLYRNTRQLLASGEQGVVTWRVAIKQSAPYTLQNLVLSRRGKLLDYKGSLIGFDLHLQSGIVFAKLVIA